MKNFLGPTFEEMKNPELIKEDIRKKALDAYDKDPLDPLNLFNINWKNKTGKMNYHVIPKELTNVDANIVMLYSKNFPTGSHKVGATYSVTMEKELFNNFDSDKDVLVYPSTGNYGIGGAWVATRLGFRAFVILPELMSKERFDYIEKLGAEYVKTPGCESNVKEIYDKCHELVAQDKKFKILNQFEVMGNYRFHYYVTGNNTIEVIEDLKSKGIGNGKAAAFVSAMGSAGTIAAADRLKQVYNDCLCIGLEPVQCPTIYSNGYGGHDIQGIGDKHVTWIHNVHNMDAIMLIDDMESKKTLQLLTNPVGIEYLSKKHNIKNEDLEMMASIFGISGTCNLIGAIKTAKHYNMTSDDTIVTVATDNISRYHSVMKQLDEKYGEMDELKAAQRLMYFHEAKTDFIQEATTLNKARWHNLKYYTWVEQQGKTVEELDAQKSEEWWIKHQEMVTEFDNKLKELRGF